MVHLENNPNKINSIEKTQRFNEALDYIEQSSNHLFITGKAGTGKSTLLEYCSNNTKKKCAILAPTGVAALNIKGQTIHSFFNFYVDITPAKVIKEYKTTNKHKLYKNLQMIIIDEVSMLRADLLDCVDAFLQLHGPEPHKPFGGIQIIFIGDLYQLPPVIQNNDSLFGSGLYETPYFFSANALKNITLKIIELDYVYRQKEQHFIELLNKIRNNSVTDQDLNLLNSRVITQETILNNKTVIYLTSTNKKADNINLDHLNIIPTESFISDAYIEGDFSKDKYPTSPQLQLKVGAQVMLLNNDSKRRWVNGTIGIIIDISYDVQNVPFLVIELPYNKKIVSIYKHTWENFGFILENQNIISKKIGSFTQYPVRLAWAITIHKSQGKTFNNVVIDLGTGSFAAGQTYVALSRCTSFQGIHLVKHIKKSDLKMHNHITKFLLQNT